MASEQARVAHVWRRLGFGPAPGDVEAGVAAGGAAAVVEDLLGRSGTRPPTWEFPPDEGNWEETERFVTRLVTLWARSPSPLQERVSWILTGLLVAGGGDQIGYGDLRAHHELLRNWRNKPNYLNLLRDVAHSAAMQKYLTNVFSVPPHPNENLARELLELFSLGVTHPVTGAANYAESDIKEIARALTGYRMDWDTGEVFFDGEYWDGGDKSFLGAARGAANLDDVVTAVGAHDSFRYHVPNRIYRELIGVEPDASTLEVLARKWSTSGNLMALIRHIARRPEFLADATIGNRVKSPAELFATTVKVLDVDDVAHWSINWTSWLMRQHPMAPPDVSGWSNAWLHPTHLVLWSTISHWYSWHDTGPDKDGTEEATPPERQSKTIRRLYAEANRATAADRALELAGLHDVSPQTRGAIDAYAHASGWTNEPWTFWRACGVMQMTLNCPEFLVS